MDVQYMSAIENGTVDLLYILADICTCTLYLKLFVGR